MSRRLLAATLAAAALSPALADDTPLGRLFLTPEQRAAIDRQRQHPLRLPGDAPELVVNGEVRRTHGPPTRWINGLPDWNGRAAAPPVPVGTTYFPATGDREDLLGDGRIVITPPEVRK